VARSLLNRRQLIGTAAALAAASPAYSQTPRSSIVDAGYLRVGHFTDSRSPTGCTVVIFDREAVAGVDVRGSAPGTRETDLLNPINTVQSVNAILLSGGSAYGLDAATGVMRYLEENKRGFSVGSVIVPIVPAAILFDLGVGDPRIRPDAQAGYQACVAASNEHPTEGCVGAGAGATVGKLFGMRDAMKSGLGSVSIAIGDTGIIVGAIVAVNAVGDVLNRENGKIIAGARTADGNAFLDSMQQILAGATVTGRRESPHTGGNTTIGIVATNARLSKSEATKVAQMSHDGLARVISPVHTGLDGDTIFAVSLGHANTRVDVSTIGAVAAEAMARAVNRAIFTATGLLPNLPAHRDLPWAQDNH
jgi:L-aminopeptidase/D-esterase-like protein